MPRPWPGLDPKNPGRNNLAIAEQSSHFRSMNFPQFWARGGNGDFSCWRWSFHSLADAQLLADQAAQQLADRFRSGNFSPNSGSYYPDRPFREQVLQEIKNGSGEIAALVTRNSYGCRVLNTARVMFVDIDLPETKPPGFLKRFFGKPDPTPPTNQQSVAMAKIETWTHNQAEWGWRVYRTRAGLRLLATQALVDADSAVADGIFKALGADPLYQKLCKTQNCFRARLTPKPWRCGVRGKPQRWPWLDAKAERRFEKWEAQYQSFAFNWATCELISHIGNTVIHPEVQIVVKLHDEATRVGSKLQLA
jgi:hypothetical protein